MASQSTYRSAFVTAACGTSTGIGESSAEAQQVLYAHHAEPIYLGQTSLHALYRAKQGRSLTGLTETGFHLSSAQKIAVKFKISTPPVHSCMAISIMASISQ